MKIQKLAERSGVSKKTIRYYEEIGLLPAAARSDSGYRAYRDSDVGRLVFIRRCRELQIPIKELKKLVRVQTDQEAPCAEVDQIINTQLAKVRARINELRQLEESLTELAHSCRQATVSQCQILRKLQA